MVGAALLLTAFAGVLTAPAQAAPSTSNVGVAAARYINLGLTDFCVDGYFCAFEGSQLGGRGVGFLATESYWGAIPAEFRWINNFAKSGWNDGIAGSYDDVRVYPLANFVSTPSFPSVCVPVYQYVGDWGALRPESNQWLNNC
jgi:hypothetical protein